MSNLRTLVLLVSLAHALSAAREQNREPVRSASREQNMDLYRTSVARDQNMEPVRTSASREQSREPVRTSASREQSREPVRNSASREQSREPVRSASRGQNMEPPVRTSAAREQNWEPVRSGSLDSESPLCCRDSLQGATNDFAFKLWPGISKRGENLFFSPLSVATAMAMTYLGAAGQTAKQMQQVLSYEKHDLDASDVHNGFQHLLTTLTAGNDQYSLMVANGIFHQRNFEVRKEYIDKLQNLYKANVVQVDFFRDGLATAKIINDWVASKTEKMIQTIFDKPPSAITKLVLLNAIYFKGTWEYEFPKDKTYNNTFHKNDGSKKSVQFMSLELRKFRFLEDQDTDYKFVELPYKGGHLSMILALPRKSESPPDLKMTTELLCRINNSMPLRELEDMIIPKFKMEFEVELKGPLRQMGMTDLFVNGIANLTGIRPQNDLKVDSVLHKAVIEVNEEGSVAAAATAVVIVPYSSRKHLTFIANHPFLLYIVDKRSGVILFAGKVADP